MKKRIVAEHIRHLHDLITKEIKSNGIECSLNHIDISKVPNISYLFQDSAFNGDISEWDTSNVKDMHGMFFHSRFNGDISKWDVSKVENMKFMFYESEFRGDISKWDVSNVSEMKWMFYRSKFNGNLTNWKTYNANCENMFLGNEINTEENKPFWLKIDNLDARKKAIDEYWLHKELTENLSNNGKIIKRVKI